MEMIEREPFKISANIPGGIKLMRKIFRKIYLISVIQEESVGLEHDLLLPSSATAQCDRRFSVGQCRQEHTFLASSLLIPHVSLDGVGISSGARTIAHLLPISLVLQRLYSGEYG